MNGKNKFKKHECIGTCLSIWILYMNIVIKTGGGHIITLKLTIEYWSVKFCEMQYANSKLYNTLLVLGDPMVKKGIDPISPW